MNNRLIKLFLTALAAFASIQVADAQFYSEGNEPARTRWSQIRTDNYRIIYPRGYDSLAFTYANLLESVRIPVSSSIGFTPNQNYRRPMPVILHPFSAYSNGMVTWAPRRMELFTVPEPFNPMPLEWPLQLTLHESRHVAQMQPSAGWAIGSVAKILTGDIFTGAMSSVLGGPAGMEGDAVLAETSLTSSGRGRCADFLEYQRACFSEGDYRNYWKWLYGSQKYYTPDHYTAGYISVAGMKTVTGDYRWPYHSLSNRIDRDFSVMAHALDSVWKDNAADRAPFMPEECLVTSKSYVDFSSLTGCDSMIFALRKGLKEIPKIVEVSPDGRIKTLGTVSGSISRLKYNPSDRHLYWSEIVPDRRWEMRSYSIIRGMDISTGKTRDLTHRTRYFNPSVSDDGTMLCVTEYPEDGSSSLVVLDLPTGKALITYSIPAGVQVVESAWIENRIYFTGISAEGVSIYKAGSPNAIFGPFNFKVKELDSHGGLLYFTSDLNGVDEFYSFDAGTSSLVRLTSSQQGSGSHLFCGDSLYYSSLSKDGRFLCRTALSDLPYTEVAASCRYEDPFAAALSAAEPMSSFERLDNTYSEPQPYSKLFNAVRFHSWAPVYFDLNLIDNLSFDAFMKYAGIGLTGFFQNDLSSLSGSVSYSAWTPERGWENAGHVKLTCNSFYPTIELSADLYDSPAGGETVSYNSETEQYSQTVGIRTASSFKSTAKIYVPWNLSKGGITRGIIPNVSWSFTNNTITFRERTTYINTLNASLRAYSMTKTPPSGIYPRWGLGAEAGASCRPGNPELFASNLFAYVYGYMPGLARTHGIRLSTMVETHAGKGRFVYPYINAAPRGSSGKALQTMARCPLHGKFTMDYALPFGAVDWSFLEPLTYIRNFELIAHYDLSFFRSSKDSGTLSSIGADICARLGNILWVPFESRIGVSLNYVNGDPDSKPFNVGLVFSVDF